MKIICDVERLIQSYIVAKNFDLIVPSLFSYTKITFEGAKNVLILNSCFVDHCGLLVDLKESYDRLCEEYNLESVRKAAITVVYLVIVLCSVSLTQLTKFWIPSTQWMVR